MSEESENWEVHIFTSYLLRKMSLQVSAGVTTLQVVLYVCIKM